MKRVIGFGGGQGHHFGSGNGKTGIHRRGRLSHSAALFLWALGLLWIVAPLLAGCASPAFRAKQAFQIDAATKAYSHLNFKNDPENFQFAIVGDREGGERPGVFPAALKRLNLLQPEFVMSIGDLIPGYTQDAALLETQWNDVDGMIDELEMPFFYVAGNHDMGFKVMRDVWQKRRGGSDYYHFIYKEVLFLVINTEDPPVAPTMALSKSYADFKTLMEKDPVKAAALLPAKRREWDHMMPPNISDAQFDYFKQVLEANPRVRWTFCFMHKPVWEDEDPRAPNFYKIEKLLADRPYTMFAGHAHNYRLTTRNGRDYIRLGTTGGVLHHVGVGNMDHIAWVTMTGNGPIVSNLLLNGIIGKDGPHEGMAGLIYDGEGIE